MKAALYRRFRPLTFDTVVGQEENMEILKEQIKTGNNSHAYIMVGTHGTGKTSSAKILARAVNCESPIDGNPCNECSTCRGILDERIIDVVEIDAASNNGVDNVREIKESCAYVPSKAKYKVYIIDEVHMLSTGAFNALLKTLEEPPAHCIFILCTTEFHKVPATIRSRCQIFNFKRVDNTSMINRMQYICGEVSAVADTNALTLIANNSQGAMRDALSIMDQCISRSKHVTEAYVKEVLGIMDNSLLFIIADSIINKDTPGALDSFNYILELGKSIPQFVDALLSIFRDMMIVKSTSSIESISNTEEYKEKLSEIASRTTIETIIKIVTDLSDLKNSISQDVYPKVRVEMGLIRLTTDSYCKDFNSLLAEFSLIKKELEDIKSSGKVVVVEKVLEVVNVTTEATNIDSYFSEPTVEISSQTKTTEKIESEEITKKVSVEDNNSNENLVDDPSDLSSNGFIKTDENITFESSNDEVHSKDPLTEHKNSPGNTSTFSMFTGIQGSTQNSDEPSHNKSEEESKNRLEEIKEKLLKNDVLSFCLKSCELELSEEILIVKTKIPAFVHILETLSYEFDDLGIEYRFERIEDIGRN